MSNKPRIVGEAGSPKSTMRSYLVRGAAGLFIGIAAGALLGVLVVILLVGWGEYMKEISDDSPAGIIFGSGEGTVASFTLIVTLLYAFWGAIICGAFGFITGLLTQLWKSKHRQSSPDAIRGDH